MNKIDNKKLLGEYNNKNIYVVDGRYGEYLRYGSINYSIPKWARKENEIFDLTHAINLLEWIKHNTI
jgi:topoisomerase IA-like protein